MNRVLIALVLLLSASPALAWDYIPIEQSRSYNAYRGPYNGGYPMWGYAPVYVAPAYGGYRSWDQPITTTVVPVQPYPVRVQVSQDPLDPFFPSAFPESSFYRGR